MACAATINSRIPQKIMETQNFSDTPSPNLSQLPFLLRLIDDSSPEVRAKIASRLRELGAGVWPEIEKRQIEISPFHREMLQTILKPVVKTETDWLEWLCLEGETEQLEAALTWLSQQRLQPLETAANIRVKSILGGLAREYLMCEGGSNPEALSAFLFQKKGLRGASGDHYYAPENSDVLWVLENKSGLPITLACIFILVAARLDIEIVGCEFPGHFLARAPMGDDEVSDDKVSLGENADLIFDCHDAGRVLQPFEVDALRKSDAGALSTPASAKSIVARVLRNFATAHHVRGDRRATLRHLSLLQQLEATKIEPI